jgi:hypothetical protein
MREPGRILTNESVFRAGMFTFQKRQHVSKCRREPSKRDLYRLDPAGFISLEIAGVDRDRRQARQDHRQNRALQRKAGDLHATASCIARHDRGR